MIIYIAVIITIILILVYVNSQNKQTVSATQASVVTNDTKKTDNQPPVVSVTTSVAPVVTSVPVAPSVAPVVVSAPVAPVVLDVDCKQSDFSKCDPATKKQTRSIVAAQSGKGLACGPESQDCQIDQDCVQQMWGTCSPITSTQTRVTTTPLSGNGKECGLSMQKCTSDRDCETSQWSACDPSTWTQSRTVTTPASGGGKPCGDLTKACALAPKLLKDTLQWQYNCTDCGGLVWGSVGSGPWNRYYKASCQNGDAESPLTQAFGPVDNNNYNNPMIRISDDWKNNSCSGYGTNIYRSKSLDGPYTKLDHSKLQQSWSANPLWDDKVQGRFKDFDNAIDY
jgi:hypothetical protein